MPPFPAIPFDVLSRPLVAVLAGAVVLAVLGAILSHRGKMRPVVPVEKKPLMTANEREFFGRLARALPDCHVFPQVAFNALLDARKGLGWQERGQTRNRFDRKVADYVICHRDTFEVLAIVELDDRTHRAEKDEQRDALLTGAGYRVIRFQSRAKPTETEIVVAINQKA
ncbi:MAG: DUF2726 domain-containing protein [Alphaproteobacteria bacterium]|nr:DUF2726 domain-containing protein [Alphaproteobacteria bacterium]